MTQQTIRVPIGYPLPGMQLHVSTPHYATLPRQNPGQNQGQKFTYPEKSSMERGVPDGTSMERQGDNMDPMQEQNQTPMVDPHSNSAVPGTVYYAMNV